VKDKALGYGFWFLIGMLIVGIAGVFFVDFVNDTLNDVDAHRPSIAVPPSVNTGTP